MHQFAENGCSFHGKQAMSVGWGLLFLVSTVSNCYNSKQQSNDSSLLLIYAVLVTYAHIMTNYADRHGDNWCIW